MAMGFLVRKLKTDTFELDKFNQKEELYRNSDLLKNVVYVEGFKDGIFFIR